MTDSSTPIIDREPLLENFAGLEEVLLEAIGDFLKLAPGWLADVQKAVEADDGPAVDRTSHALKGAASNFQATATMKAAKNLEVAGRKGDSDFYIQGYQELNAELEKLCVELQKLTAELSARP